MSSCSDNWIDEFEDFTCGIMEEHDIPGLSVAVADAREIIYSKGFGKRNIEQDLAATDETIYGMASVTKSFTALAVLILEEEGKLSIGDPVVKYLPEFKVPNDVYNHAMTIQHFINHTAGLPPTPALRYCMVRSMEGDPTVDLLKDKGKWEDWTDHPPIDTYAELLSFLSQRDLQLLGPPGKQLSYSNDAYSLLGCIVERVSGQPFEDFVAERILEPLNMNNSTFDLDFVETSDDVTQLYTTNDDEVLAAPKWQHAPAMLGAGFLRSTVLDMVKYGQMHLRRGLSTDNKRILSQMGVALMRSGAFPSGRKIFYGYGLRVRPDYHGVNLIGHGGSLKGVSSQFGFIPEKGLTIMVTANLQGVPAAKIWMGAANLLLGLPVDTPKSVEPEYDADAEELKRFVGVYQSGEGAEISIEFDDDQLYAEMNGQRKCLRPSGVDSVAVMRRGQETRMQFLTGPDGQVDSMFFGLRIIQKVK